MEIQEADIAAMGREELEELIDRAVRPDVPLRVLFAALDRYTELLRPALDDEAESGIDAGSAGAASPPAGSPASATSSSTSTGTDSAATGTGAPAVSRHSPSGLDSAIP